MTDVPANYRSGFVAILGKPNAGKSTLLNALVGEKLAAVSGLPQTTRDRINGIVSEEGYQAIFVDLPGLTRPDDMLNTALLARIEETLSQVDAVVHLVDLSDPKPVTDEMRAILARVKCPVILAGNKADRLATTAEAAARLDAIRADIGVDRYVSVLVLSARQDQGVRALLDVVVGLLPQGPPYFDPEDLTDRPMRFLAAETIREKVFLLTHEEVPYATAVEIEEFTEREGAKWYIGAVVHVERETQKGIVIGKGGAMLKKISQAARLDLEKTLGQGVFLSLHVKVSPDWRRSERKLRSFGYELPKQKRKGER